MKKKLFTLMAAFVCAVTCALGLAACGEGEPKLGYLSFSDESREVNLLIETTYGETPDLSYKLYAYYDNGNGGEYKELPLTDENLKVKYTYFKGDHTEEITKLPDKYLYGTYSIEYSYNDAKATVNISVEKATGGAFTVHPQKTSWFDNEKTPTFTVKNPQGKPVAQLTEGDSLSAVSPDDTQVPNGVEFGAYLFKKSVYDAFGDEQKTNYEYLRDYMSGHQQGEDWQYFMPDSEYFPVGEYMLFVMIDRTYNYQDIVTSAVQITVKDSVVERVFTFQKMVLQDNDGNELTDEDNEDYGEYVTMTESMNTSNAGKTVVCKANGEVRGTVDFAGGAFDELSGEDILRYFKNGANVTIGTGSSDVLSGIGDGVLSGNTFTLTLPIYGTDYKWVVTFTA